MNKRELAKKHEQWIAKQYNGIASPSSGAADTDKGDVRVESSKTIFECKYMGEPGRPKHTTLLGQMEKVADEAWAESKEPAVALRVFCPESPLASVEGWVDMTVRLTRLDAENEARRGD